MLKFNLKGFLTPETLILSTIDELENEFVIKFKDQHRHELFERYKKYCNDLKLVCDGALLTQWIDGSYISQDKNPSDFDLLTFIDYNTASSKEIELKKFISPQSIASYGVDAYLIVVYPVNSRSYFITQSDRSCWIDLFGKTKPNRKRKRIPKGFLEINI